MLLKKKSLFQNPSSNSFQEYVGINMIDIPTIYSDFEILLTKRIFDRDKFKILNVLKSWDTRKAICDIEKTTEVTALRGFESKTFTVRFVMDCG